MTYSSYVKHNQRGFEDDDDDDGCLLDYQIFRALEIVLCVIMPPLAVFLERGCGVDFIISLCLSCILWVPGILFALYIVLKYETRILTARRLEDQYPEEEWRSSRGDPDDEKRRLTVDDLIRSGSEEERLDSNRSSNKKRQRHIENLQDREAQWRGTHLDGMREEKPREFAELGRSSSRRSKRSSRSSKSSLTAYAASNPASAAATTDFTARAQAPLRSTVTHRALSDSESDF